MRLRNTTTGEVIATAVQRAEGVVERIVGLLNRSHIDREEGIWFPNCAAIHTLGMREPIDVVFLDRENRVVQTLRNVRTNRVAVACRGAHATVELGSGALDGRDILTGDRLELE